MTLHPPTSSHDEFAAEISRSPCRKCGLPSNLVAVLTSYLPVHCRNLSSVIKMESHADLEYKKQSTQVCYHIGASRPCINHRHHAHMTWPESPRIKSNGPNHLGSAPSASRVPPAARCAARHPAKSAPALRNVRQCEDGECTTVHAADIDYLQHRGPNHLGLW